MAAERDNDGDWRVYVPAPDLESYQVNEAGDSHEWLIEGMECSNGILYLGAPETPVEVNW